jgi:hypothetical protein
MQERSGRLMFRPVLRDEKKFLGIGRTDRFIKQKNRSLGSPPISVKELEAPQDRTKA